MAGKTGYPVTWDVAGSTLAVKGDMTIQAGSR